MVFFGTPHAGANGAEFQAVLNNIARIFVPGNSKILQLLKRDSDYLRYLTELYSSISSHFKTVFFYEEFNTPLFKGASIMVNRFASYNYTEFITLICRLFQRHLRLFWEQPTVLPLHCTSTILTW